MRRRKNESERKLNNFELSTTSNEINLQRNEKLSWGEWLEQPSTLVKLKYFVVINSSLLILLIGLMQYFGLAPIAQY